MEQEEAFRAKLDGGLATFLDYFDEGLGIIFNPIDLHLLAKSASVNGSRLRYASFFQILIQLLDSSIRQLPNQFSNPYRTLLGDLRDSNDLKGDLSKVGD